MTTPIVVPLLLSRAPVTNNEFLPPSLLAATAAKWNSAPVVSGSHTHHKRIGHIINARIESDSLLADAVVDPSLVEPALLSRFRANEHVPASIYISGTASNQRGTYAGVAYEHIWHTLTPKHVAVSLTETAADSGCGSLGPLQPLTSQKDHPMPTSFIPRRLADGRVCCSGGTLDAHGVPTALCAACKAYLANGSRQLRTAARSRELPFTEKTIQSARDLHHTGHDQSVALGAECPGWNDDTDDNDQDTETSRTAASRSARPVRHLVAPDPYQIPHTEKIDATYDPKYRPHGRPPNGYALGVAMRQLKANPNATRPILIKRDGVVDTYATALARRSA
jgi:hypothetical protein